MTTINTVDNSGVQAGTAIWMHDGKHCCCGGKVNGWWIIGKLQRWWHSRRCQMVVIEASGNGMDLTVDFGHIANPPTNQSAFKVVDW